mmetsp:Transcript_72357/g.106052  ORF Transcript_72357/g.106052 Transcript_72357/m.106052 type:complete len:159 (+) Transcript_72357:129-605(+)
MSYMLPHLDAGYAVDQAILSEEDRAVIIRFGHDWDPACMKMDETLYHVADKIKNFAVMFVAFSPLKSRMLLLLLHAYVCSPSLHATTLVIHVAFPSHGFACTRFRPCSYLVDISEVPDFNTMYELYDPVTVMFFFRSPQPSNAPASRFECKFARTPTP